MARKGTRLANGRYTPWDLTQVLMLEPEDPEWRRAWEVRKQLSGDDDFDAKCPLTGEVWQYMDTAPYEGEWMHCFRHRHHPVKNDRWYVRVPVDPEWVRNQTRRGRVRSYRSGATTRGVRDG